MTRRPVDDEDGGGHPTTLAALRARWLSRGEAALVGSGELGPAVLVGSIPMIPGAGWIFRTRKQLIPNTPAVEAAGLSFDMHVWPLRRQGVAAILGQKEFRIGRAPTNEVALEHPDVSKLHARITVAGDDAAVADQGSANGTAVNGVRVPAGGSLPLRSGDRITFGPIKLTFLTVPELVKLVKSDAT